MRVDLPNWPRRMKAPLAAAYIGVSPSQFAIEVKAGRIRPATKVGRSAFWYREDLDADLDRLKDEEATHGDPLLEALA